MNDAEEPPEPPEPDDAPAGRRLSSELAGMIARGEYTAAARVYAAATGADLIESKLAVERLARKHGHGPKTGCGHLLAGCVLLAAGLAALIAG